MDIIVLIAINYIIKNTCPFKSSKCWKNLDLEPILPFIRLKDFSITKSMLWKKLILMEWQTKKNKMPWMKFEFLLQFAILVLLVIVRHFLMKTHDLSGSLFLNLVSSWNMLIKEISKRKSQKRLRREPNFKKNKFGVCSFTLLEG